MDYDKSHVIRKQLFLIDWVIATFAYYTAACIRYGFQNVNPGVLYQGFSYIVMVLILLILAFSTKTSETFFIRGFKDELYEVIKMDTMLIFAIAGILLYHRRGVFYSRLFLIYFYFTYLLYDYIVRQYGKLIIIMRYRKKKYRKNVMIVATKDRIRTILDNMRNNENASDVDKGITGIILVGEEKPVGSIKGIKVMGNEKNAMEVIAQQIVDEVFISVPGEYQELVKKMLVDIKSMGISVDINVLDYALFMRKKQITSFGGLPVIHFSSLIYERHSRVVKRFIDIIGSLFGLIVTFLVGIVLVPMIKIESKGPAIFSQIRIGRNGRKFRMYKFRSMYQDAEKRKQELMEQNEMSGFMFKVTDDPRITKVGKFIRKTSLDELPQFYNVLIGDMSLVGTRPPTVDEFTQYELHHRKRMAIKPGLTGMWQVSGRSDITDFEEVVELDTQYIDNWSLKLDIKILLKTFVIIFGRNGAK